IVPNSRCACPSVGTRWPFLKFHTLIRNIWLPSFSRYKNSFTASSINASLLYMRFSLLLFNFLCASLYNTSRANPPSYIATGDGSIVFANPSENVGHPHRLSLLQLFSRAFEQGCVSVSYSNNNSKPAE